MKKDEMERRLREAARRYGEGKRVDKRPETQFRKGAEWLWDVLMEQKDALYYEQTLRQEIMNRTGEVEPWMDSLISDTARMMADRDAMQAEIERTGRLIEKIDKNMNPYKESNPLYVHLKEKERSIGMQREHLGLSYKVNPKRITENTKKGGEQHNRLQSTLDKLSEV